MINRNEQDDTEAPVTRSERRGEVPAYSAARPRSRRANPARRLIPVLILAVFGVFIARQQIPAFADWWERTFMTAAWQTKSTCRQAALADLKDGRYARLLHGGDLHETPDGPYLTQMRFAVLGSNGQEQVVEYNCYLDSQGRLYRLNRRPE
jgi:hypothetical protein